MRRLLCLAGFLLPITALAVPTTMTHQGRLLDSTGAPLTGTQSVVFSMHDASASGTELWSETVSVDFDNGYFAVELGQTDALDSAVFAGDDVFLELAVAGATPTDRIRIHSVAYAVKADGADTAVNVDGGTVNATSVTVGGQEVINSSGNVPWAVVSGAPVSLEDLGCADGQIAERQGGSWGCVDTPSGDITDLVVSNSATLAAADVVGNLEVAGGTTLADTLVDGDLLVTGTISGTLEQGSLGAGRVCPKNHFLAMGYCMPKTGYVPKTACTSGVLRNGVCYDWDGSLAGTGQVCNREDLESAELACASDGGRLCTVPELDRLDGSGCGGDHSLSWALLTDDVGINLTDAPKGACIRRQGIYVTGAGVTAFQDDENDDIAECQVIETRPATVRDSSFTAYRMCCYD